MKQVITLTVNGDPYDIIVKPKDTLLHIIRDKIGLTGTKQACDTGDCGSCTVLVDGKPVSSCITLAIDVADKDITTIEGLASGEKLHPIQEAFINHGAVQCGFCTPGMILVTKYLLEQNPDPSEEEIKDALIGNMCRCTGYVKIIEAIQAVAKELSAMAV